MIRFSRFSFRLVSACHPPTKNRQGTTEPGKPQAVEETIRLVEKKLGRGIIMRMGDATARMSVETVATGSIGLDLALGIGGIPRGRVSKVFAPRKHALQKEVLLEQAAILQ